MTKTEDNPMHLKMREPSRLRQGPRCLARTRRGTPCQSPAAAGKTRLPNAWRRGRQRGTQGRAEWELAAWAIHVRGHRRAPSRARLAPIGS
jgi:hypothetical protein